MDIEEALAAIRNLGVSLNDYDSQALDTIVGFVVDVIESNNNYSEQQENFTED